MKLFFDTETTGKAYFDLPFDHPSQPRLVQLAARLYRDDGRCLQSIACIVRPEGFEIPEEASAIHGIDNQTALGGFQRDAILDLFNDMYESSQTIIGHNIDFDIIVMSRELGLKLTKPSFCTMRASTDVCKLPGRYGKYKWPKLSEAYEFAFKRPLTNAHDALVDIQATKELYDWLASNTATRQPAVEAPAP